MAINFDHAIRIGRGPLIDIKPRAKAKVDKDLAQATAAGGRGTPYFIIYNRKTGDTSPVSGAVPFSSIQAAIQVVS